MTMPALKMAAATACKTSVTSNRTQHISQKMDSDVINAGRKNHTITGILGILESVNGQCLLTHKILGN